MSRHTDGLLAEPQFSTDVSTVCAPLGHGTTIAAHFHDFGQLRYAATGALVTATSVGTWVAPATRMTWVPPFYVHSSRSHGETEVRLLSITADLAARLPREPAVFVATALAREAFLSLSGDPDGVGGPRARLLLEVVLEELARAPQEQLRLPEPTDDRLRAVTDLLHADPADASTLAELGRRTGASERTLSRLFRSELSMGFPQWRTLLRVQRSLLELAGGTSVTDTATRLGWANPSSFIEAFTALVGETPGRHVRAATRVGDPGVADVAGHR